MLHKTELVGFESGTPASNLDRIAIRFAWFTLAVALVAAVVSVRWRW